MTQDIPDALEAFSELTIPLFLLPKLQFFQFFYPWTIYTDSQSFFKVITLNRTDFLTEVLS